MRRLPRTLQGQKRLRLEFVRADEAIGVILAVVIVIGAAAAAWALSAPRPRYTPAEWQALGLTGDAAAGRLVFFAGGCESCHKSPGQDDPLKLGGGLELKTPFGSFYPPNISSDPVDGIGGWRPVDVANALLSGVSRDGQHLYPAFPYSSYQRMTPKDVADLAAFLHTLPAVKGRAPKNALPFPLSIRRAVGLWKLLYFDNSGLLPIPGKARNGTAAAISSRDPAIAANVTRRAVSSARWRRAGRWPARRCLTAMGKSANLRGGDFLNWTNADIVEALTSGFTPAGDVLGSGMTAVVRNLAELPESDRQAIAVYLKSLPPLGPPAPAKP